MAEAVRILKQQRIVLSSALLVGLVLVFFVHAPIVPVALGCVLASALLVARSIASSSTKGNR